MKNAITSCAKKPKIIMLLGVKNFYGENKLLNSKWDTNFKIIKLLHAKYN